VQFSDIIKRSWNDNILFSALIELTYRCNLDCFFCYNDTSLQGTSLTREQYFKLFEELRELGAMNLILSGGEPLAHPDFFELGKKARQLGFVVRIKSNGHALRERLAHRIKEEIDPFIIEISLHGACTETHDRQTRVAGSFEMLIQNLQILKELDLRFRLNSTLTTWNAEEVEAMYVIAERFGVNLQIDTTVTLRDNGDRTPLDVAPSAENLQSLFRIQKRMIEKKSTVSTPSKKMQSDSNVMGGLDGTKKKTASGRHCGAGSSTVAIDPFGNVYPCVQWRRTIGSLHDDCIANIWSNNESLASIRQENDAASQALDDLGKNKQAAAFCPGLACSLTGKATEIYPVARLRHQLLVK